MDLNRIDWFEFWASITPDAVAITMANGDHPYTYGHIHERSQQIASTLYHDVGIRKGDRIGVLSKNCIEYIYLFAAAQKLGFILVPFNYRLTPFEREGLIQNAQPKLIFCSEEFDFQPDLCPIKSLNSLVQFQKNDPFPTPALSENDAVFILYTSGSSGFPKGVIYTHKMLFWNSVNTSVSLGVNAESIALVSMPPFHTGGWNVLLTPLLHHGGKVVLSEKFDAQETLIHLEKYECNQFMAVPTMLKMIAAETAFETIDLPNLSYIIVGGEAMPIELIHIYESKSIAVRQGFGMTEVGPNLTSLHHQFSKIKLGSIGKPNMYVQIKLIDEAGNTLTHNQIGELCLKGPVVSPGYWNSEKSKESALIDGWFHTGDIALRDEEGYYYIKDRKKNMFISGGENVYPAEIERTLRTHPNIAEAAVIGVKDEKWGEVGKAFVVCDQELTYSAIQAYCKTKLSKYKVPKHINFIEALPLNSSGKIDKKKLKELD